MTDRQTDSRQTQIIFMPLDRQKDPLGPTSPESPGTNNCMPESQFGHRMLENSTFTAVFKHNRYNLLSILIPNLLFAQPKSLHISLCWACMSTASFNASFSVVHRRSEHRSPSFTVVHCRSKHRHRRSKLRSEIEFM